eukprot:TRINITY_DN17352_c0_g1_i1.p1 TRINITY_DN17352_c0_g1~~TRINITY_DN17352_c0_g1_i1.p1  ORF type:complete len:284 (+),score=61.77 TRINITY_DN17352_c0_g1_i1:176-1027(+)
MWTVGKGLMRGLGRANSEQIPKALRAVCSKLPGVSGLTDVRAETFASTDRVSHYFCGPTELKPAAEATTSEPNVYTVGAATNIKWHESKVTREERQAIMNQKGCVVWFTGLSGSGKSTLAYTVDHALASMGKLSYVLDGDNIRHGLNKNLGFSAADRTENIRRIGEVSKLFADSNVITLVSFISPYRADRDSARALVPDGTFLEVYMKIPLSVCEQRDPKGLYKAARAGKIKGFTGIDDPYEEPTDAEIVIEVAKEDGILAAPEKMAKDLIEQLEARGFLRGD